MENNVNTTEQTMSIERKRNTEVGRVTIGSYPLHDIVKGLLPIANNNKMPAEKVINIFINDNTFAATATDKVISSSITGKCSAQGQFYFSLSANSLSELVSEELPITFIVFSERVVLQRGQSRYELVLYEPTVRPFTLEAGEMEIVKGPVFLNVLSSLSKYISTETNEFNAVMFHEGYAYVRDRLVYAIVEFPLRTTAVFSKTASRQIVTLLGKKYSKSEDGKVGVRFNKATNQLEISSNRVRIKMNSFNYGTVELAPFLRVFNTKGNSMFKEDLKKAISELKASDNATDAYISLEPNKVRLRPKREDSRTEIHINASSTPGVDFGSDFNFSVNLGYLEKVINGINSHTVAIAKQDRVCIIVGQEREVLIRYFMSVF